MVVNRYYHSENDVYFDSTERATYESTQTYAHEPSRTVADRWTGTKMGGWWTDRRTEDRQIGGQVTGRPAGRVGGWAGRQMDRLAYSCARTDACTRVRACV